MLQVKFDFRLNFFNLLVDFQFTLSLSPNYSWIRARKQRKLGINLKSNLSCNIYNVYSPVPTLDNAKSFQWIWNSDIFLYNTGQLQQGKVLKNINPKVAVEFVKRAQHYVLFWFTCFQVFQNCSSLLAFSLL